MIKIGSDKMDRYCYECIHFRVYEDGDGYNEPRTEEISCKYAESKNSRTSEMILDIIDNDGNANGCPLFDAGKCRECGRKIGMDESIVVLGIYDSNTVCSKECQKICQDKIDKIIKEDIL